MSTYSGKTDFVSKIMEATNAVLGILVAVVLDEAESEAQSVKVNTVTGECEK